MKNLDIIMHTTFDREKHAKKCIDSFYEMTVEYPAVLHIADTGTITTDKLSRMGHGYGEHHLFGWDVSPAITRNYLINSKAKGDYVMKIDDDFYFDKNRTPLELYIQAMELLESLPDVGLIGFGVESSKYVSKFVYDLAVTPGVEMRKVNALNKPKKQYKDLEYLYCDVTPDCWIAKRSIFPECNYDERYHVGEGLHTDFFAHIKYNTPYKVIYSPTLKMYTFKHDEGWEMSAEERAKSYYNTKRFRNGIPPRMEYFKHKWNVNALVK